MSALESLQTSYEQQQQAWQDSYSSLQHMFEATSQALTHSDRVCQHLSSQVESLRAQVESEQERQPLDALIAQHDRACEEKLREQQPEPQKTDPLLWPSM
ncbi:MbeD family mobilization/exclusion protein [Serratia ureilytica]